jgi:hypothetical protein
MCGRELTAALARTEEHRVHRAPRNDATSTAGRGQIRFVTLRGRRVESNRGLLAGHRQMHDDPARRAPPT